MDLIKDPCRRLIVAVLLVEFVEPRLIEAHRRGPRVSVDAYPDEIHLIDVGRVHALCKAVACKWMRREMFGGYRP